MVKLRHHQDVPREYQQIIGITFSPDEELYNFSDVSSIFVEACHNCADYTFYPEFRDKVQHTGLHYHGVIKIYDKYKWFKRGKVFFDKCTNMKPRYEINISADWYNYIVKDQPIPSPSSSPLDLPYLFTD